LGRALHIERLLLAGTSFDKARAVFGGLHQERPRARLTIRQRTRVLQQRPPRVEVFASLIMDLIGRWMLHRPVVLLGFMSADETARSCP
jgi:hypothetical protein